MRIDLIIQASLLLLCTVWRRMDAIKAKMKKLASETGEATVKADRFDTEAVVVSGEAGKMELSMALLQKKYQAQVMKVFSVCCITTKHRRALTMWPLRISST